MKRFHTAALLATALVFTPAAIGSAAAQATAANSPGAQAYAKHCSVCHGDQRQGNLPAFPPLLDIGRKYKEQQIADIVHTGRGRMPPFPNVQGGELTALLHFLTAEDVQAAHASSPGGANNLAEAGGHLFQRNCAFCHGRDAGGGETGPDLTRSKLVAADQNGDKIGEVVRNGRPEKKMPAFNFSSDEVASLAAFIHSQRTKAEAHPGGRRGVDVADLQTGNVEAGKAYFNGAGGCSKCHSPTGDLAGIASKFEGLQLEQQMLYPRDAKSHVTVTLPAGEKVTGELAYLDEFTVGLRDSNGIYRSWSVNRVHYKVDSPVEAHAEQFPKYTDADIHNLMAYLQTLR